MSARASRSRVVLPSVVWSLTLAVVMLGPALGPGFVLLRDMVFVPHLDLGRADVLGLGSALPRAVPSDAVVAVLDQVVGGMVLQKLVLLGSLAGAGVGMAVLVGGAQVARLSAASVAIWNPFVVERLAIGHWPVLAGYAALPWLLLAGRRIAAGGAVAAWLPLVLIAGSLSANAGVVSALALGVSACVGGVRRRSIAVLAVLVAAVNAPWIVAGLAHAAASTGAGGWSAFAPSADALPTPLAVLTLGGIWNTGVVPGSREGIAAWIGLIALVALAVAGWRRWRTPATPASSAGGQGRTLLVLWLIAMAVAWVSWLAPGPLGRIGEHVPGLGLLRDGTRSLGLAVPLTAALVAAGVERLVALPRERVAALALAAVGVLGPVALLPDAAAGLSGELDTARLPGAWSQVRAVVEPGHGSALVLPWSAYRAPAWNGGRPVLDPLPRMLRTDAVINGDLLVGQTLVAGEDPRAADAGRVLAAATPAARAEGLRGLGIGWVVQELDAGTAPEVAGTVVLDDPLVRVVRLDGTITRTEVATATRVAQGAAWVAYLAVVVASAAALLAAAARTAAARM
ncbi:hypothetical protein [Nocardioides sp.]|uniref:hypothetical protein n=1 Tax=Nocardioides sp. TaxID=35761 RepID=UPI00263929CF|nr:hypothetical protein [Nocardioides sp.]